MDSSIELFAEHILNFASKYKASDIHFLPQYNKGLIRFRIFGEIIPYKTIKKQVYIRLLSHFKYLSSMDIGEKRKPQNGSLIIKKNQQTLQLRLSTLPSKDEETLVIRLHSKELQLPLSKLSIFPKSSNYLSDFLHHPQGLFIFTGSTGSGKSTTLYSLLKEDVSYEKNIITIEDPVEQKYDHLIQMQVNEKAGLTFISGLKSILRNDPDIIMLGEIRDSETAKIAVQASLTGHVVFTTLHAKNTIGAIYRLMDLGVSIINIEQVLKAVINQQIINIKCPFCKSKCNIHCSRKKRLAIFEILKGNHLKKGIDEAKGLKVNHTYKTLESQLLKCYLLGYITKNDLKRKLK